MTTETKTRTRVTTANSTKMSNKLRYLGHRNSARPLGGISHPKAEKEVKQDSDDMIDDEDDEIDDLDEELGTILGMF